MTWIALHPNTVNIQAAKFPGLPRELLNLRPTTDRHGLLHFVSHREVYAIMEKYGAIEALRMHKPPEPKFSRQLVNCIGSKRHINVNDPRGFNAGIADLPDGRKLCVYRNGPGSGNETRYIFLDGAFNPLTGWRDIGLSNNGDARMNWHNGELFMSTHWWGGGVRMELRKLSIDGDTLHWKDIAKFTHIEGLPMRGWEKNWAPFTAPDGRFCFVYSVNPHRIIEVDLHRGAGKLIATSRAMLPMLPHGATELRLSAPPIFVERLGEYLSTYHYCVGDARQYFTGFYRFKADNDFRVTHFGKPIIQPEDSTGICQRTGGARLLFIQGMKVDTSRDEVELHGGDNDEYIMLAETSLEVVISSMTKVEQCEETPLAVPESPNESIHNFEFRGKQFTVVDAAGSDSVPTILNEIRSGYCGLFDLPNVKKILDVGSHVGAVSLAMKQAYPDAEMFAVEPCVQSFERFQRNWRSNGNNTHGSIFPFALTDGKTQSTKLHFNPHNSGGTSACWKTENSSSVTVETATMDWLLMHVVGKRGAGIMDIVKLDCEGAEYEIVATSKLLCPPLVRFLVAEIHLHNGHKDIREAEQLIAELKRRFGNAFTYMKSGF